MLRFAARTRPAAWGRLHHLLEWPCTISFDTQPPFEIEGFGVSERSDKPSDSIRKGRVCRPFTQVYSRRPLKPWRETEPQAPDGPWCKKFGFVQGLRRRE